MYTCSTHFFSNDQIYFQLVAIGKNPRPQSFQVEFCHKIIIFLQHKMNIQLSEDFRLK